MSEDTTQIELEDLKTTADMLGISYHPSIGLDKLKAKIAEHEAGAPVEEAPAAPVKAETEAEKRARLKKEQTALVRIRLTCMNPYKSEWTGEIFSIGNNVIGTVKRFVPFNEIWHVEAAMLEMIKERKCQVFHTERVNGRQIRKGKLVNEFAIEVLPPLTEQELKELAQRQAMANGTAAA